jgi:ABC-type lipoprotein export system ATPase subunit
MEDVDTLLNTPILEVRRYDPEVAAYLADLGLRFASPTQTINELLASLSSDDFDDLGVDASNVREHIRVSIELIADAPQHAVHSVTILGGHNKFGVPENVSVTLQSGTVTSIVGPTGSGKSRLLADIEWMAQDDTPTGRTILVNGSKPDVSLRFSLEHKLVAQLSQNMNFVMDVSVLEFIALHAESRSIAQPELIAAEVLRQANLLAGEPFEGTTPVTALSGGQSRALMIADTAFLSLSPVVLIDEIENAGIDRKKALSLLVRNDKIVLIATHDPILALMAERRLVIKNGGIHCILETSEAELNNLEVLQELDNKLLSYRNRLRNGEQLGVLE